MSHPYNPGLHKCPKCPGYMRYVGYRNVVEHMVAGLEQKEVERHMLYQCPGCGHARSVQIVKGASLFSDMGIPK